YLNDSKFGSKSSASQPFQMTAADQQILQDATYYRVMNTTVSTFNDASTSYFHKSIGGYHGAKLKRYQELIERQISKGNMNVLNMLNTKYFIVNNPQDNTPAVQINQGALGNAWFVENWKVVPNADAEIAELDSMNTKTTAVIDQRFADEVKGLEQNVIDSTASITLNADGYSPKELKYTSNSSKDRLAVFSEVHYPAGWNAYVDGKLTPHIRLNYVLRGMKVPAGKHEIVFKFEPKVFIEGEQIALAGSIALFLVVAGVAFMEFRKPKGEAPTKA
ncbi:MAG TPA: YfhO family protein, partial [Bacteroidia bacterium]|nr:YfhO family protein [Bacteroidia bacterium]